MEQQPWNEAREVVEDIPTSATRPQTNVHVRSDTHYYVLLSTGRPPAARRGGRESRLFGPYHSPGVAQFVRAGAQAMGLATKGTILTVHARPRRHVAAPRQGMPPAAASPAAQESAEESRQFRPPTDDESRGP